MKNSTNKYYILTFLFSFTLGQLIISQRWSPNLIQHGQTFQEVVESAENFFEENGKGPGSGFKQFKRWQHNTQFQVSSNKAISNVSVRKYQALRNFNREWEPTSRSTHGNWKNIGPFDYNAPDVSSGGGIGRVNCITFHPTNSNIFWIGTPAGGLWKTLDAGSTWFPMTDHLTSIGVSGVAVNPSNPDEIFILTGDGDGADSPSFGILKTEDGGMNWKLTGYQVSPDTLVYGYKLLMHPTNPSILFAAMRQAGGGIMKSIDGGNTWYSVGPSNTVWDIEFLPGNPMVMFAGSGAGFIKSIDGGETWNVISSGLAGGMGRIAVAISPAQPTDVYVLFGGGVSAGTFSGIFKSTNYGDSFTLQANTPNILGNSMNGSDNGNQGGYDLSLIVDPSNSNTLFVGGVNTWKSVDGGVNWDRETWWTRQNHPIDPYVHADFHNFAYQGSTLFAVNDGGVYKTNDAGNSWTELTAGICNTQFYEIDVLNNEWMGGTQDNGTMGADTATISASSLGGGDGFGCVWHWGDNSIQYLSSQNSLVRRQANINLLIWQESNGFWDTDLEMHTTDADYLIFNKGSELFRGKQNVFPWDWTFDSLGTGGVLPGNGDILGYEQGTIFDDTTYVVNTSGILRTYNFNALLPTWTLLPNPDTFQITDVTAHPSNPNKVWVSCGEYNNGSRVFFSSDGGMSWTDVSGSLPAIPIRRIIFQPGSNDGIYIGTEFGVFYRNASMTDWVFFSNHLPNTIVADLVIKDGYLYAGTYGRGIWRTPLYSTCPMDLVLTPANDPSNPLSLGEQHYSASNSITSTREIQGGFAQIIYSAGNFVDMLPGFLAEKNNFMIAKPDGCPE